MRVSLSEDWKAMVDELVQAGRYRSAEEVVTDALELFKENDAKLQALRDKIEASIAGGGSYSSEEVRAYLEAEMDRWEQARKPQ